MVIQINCYSKRIELIITMCESFSIEEPLDLEIRIVFGLDCGLQVEGLSLAQPELWVERFRPDRFGICALQF
jgi:hypothetical protein